MNKQFEEWQGHFSDAEPLKRSEALIQIWQNILAELARAEHLHPVWPAVGHRGDHVRAVGRMLEEAGETLKAVNDYEEGKGSLAHIHQEAIQAGAMAVRFLQNLDTVERQRINEVDNEHEIYTCGHGCGLRYREVEEQAATVTAVTLNDWEWWAEDNPIRYPVKAERLTLADYVEGCNQ